MARPRWAKSAELLFEVDEDGHGSHWGEVMFRDVPLGHGDSADVWVTTATDERGNLVIAGLTLSKPMTARRLRGLPLEALRTDAARVISEEDRATSSRLRVGPPRERRAADHLAEVAVTDRSSEEFLAAVAATANEARANGEAAWQAVGAAVGVQRAQATRYMKAARDAGLDLGELARTTELVQPIVGSTERER